MFPQITLRPLYSMRHTGPLMLVVLACLAGCAGCGAGGGPAVLRSPRSTRVLSMSARPPAGAVHLAAMAQADAARPSGVASATTRPAGDVTGTAPASVDDPGTGSVATTRPASSAARYTAPGMGFRQLDILATGVALAGLPMISDEARDASQSAVAAIGLRTEGVVGRPGLATAPTTVATGVLTRGGLQRGPGTGLGFGSSRFSIFRARANPASGANGRNAELIAAGFTNLPSLRR